jgi:hypothetical protein
MPAAVGDGWPVTMCRSGLPAGLFAHADDQHEHENSDELRWEKCSFGVLFSAVAITSEYALHVPYLREIPSPAAFTRNSIDSTVFAFHSRAPPAWIL